MADAICVWLKTSQSGGQAFAVVEVDSPAPEAVLQEIKGLKEVEDVRGIRL